MKRLTKTKDQGVQSYMFLRKYKQSLASQSPGNFLWAINLLLFVAVVFLGIEQAGRGAEISNLESKIEDAIVLKRDISESIFVNESDTKIASRINDLGFVKPTNVYYFKTENIFASLSVR